MRCPSTPANKVQKVFSKIGTIYQGIITSTAFDDGSSRLLRLLHWSKVPLPTLLLYRKQTSEVALMIVVNLAAIIQFILLNVAILLRKEATTTGSILLM